MIYVILIFIIIIFVIIAIVINIKCHKKGGINNKDIEDMIKKSSDLDKLIMDKVKKLSIHPVKDIKNPENIKNPKNIEDPITMTETEKIENFILKNTVTKFVTKKGKEYSLIELLQFLKIGNIPQGTIYTNIPKNIYKYQ